MHSLQNLLLNLGLSTKDSFSEFFPFVRDRKDISVLKCNKSGVFLLSSMDHIHANYYQEKEGLKYWDAKTRQEALNVGDEDAERRMKNFKSKIINQKWLEVGAGNGACIEKLSRYAKQTVAVEPQSSARTLLSDLGYQVYHDICEVPDHDFNVVTLFHVLEHLKDPLFVLAEIKKRMLSGANIIIEVPHADDFLISFLGLDEFKAFTFWSEHLVLHTRESLQALLQASGFNNIVIQGVQRYPLANHLHWLAEKKPNGHRKWSELRTDKLDEAYEAMLASINKTDTLIATAVNI